MIENKAAVPGGWLYALACVLLPMVWGLLMVVVIQWIERLLQRRRRAEGKTDNLEDVPAVALPDYHI